jgi:hypothetical protein
LNTTSSPRTPPAVFRCRVAARAAVQATDEAIAQWRRQPPPLAGSPLPGSFLKHSEEQTVTAVAAVHTAITQAGWSGRSFSDWGVVAAANFFGRGGTAVTLQRFRQEGAWGVSPHMIPHHSVHAVSGTLSQVLKIYGPNFGIGGGGPGACLEAVPVAAALLAERTVPGLWLLFSGHEREWTPVEDARSVAPPQPPRCEAVALALVPADGDESGLYLSAGTDGRPAGSSAWADLPAFTLSALVAHLGGRGPVAAAAWRLPESGWFGLDVVAPGTGSRR